MSIATAQTRRRIMRSFKIHEVSAVDKPAQRGAQALIIKRAGAGRSEFAKSFVLMTEATDGHAHLLQLTDGGGMTWLSSSPGREGTNTRGLSAQMAQSGSEKRLVTSTTSIRTRL